MKQLIVKQMVVALALLGMCLSVYALTDKQRAEIEERIKPVGQVCLQGDSSCGSAVAAAGGEPKSGEDVYSASCQACHAGGVGGAPKLGDESAWEDRLSKGIDQVYANAINGLNAMPPKGTCMSCSDEEIQATVDYMLESSD